MNLNPGFFSISRQYIIENFQCQLRNLEWEHLQNREGKMVTGALFWPAACSRQPTHIVI